MGDEPSEQDQRRERFLSVAAVYLLARPARRLVLEKRLRDASRGLSPEEIVALVETAKRRAPGRDMSAR